VIDSGSLPVAYSTSSKEDLPTPDAPMDYSDPFPDEPTKALNVRAFQLTTYVKGKWYNSIRKATQSDPLFEIVSKDDKHPDWLLCDGILIKRGEDDNIDCPYDHYEAAHQGHNIRSEIIRITHEQMVHMGAQKCYKYASRHFYWFSMRSDFRDYVRRCHLCQMNKQPTTVPEGSVTPLPVPREPFSSLAIDFAGPFPHDSNKDLILVVLDRFSGFTYLIPVSKNITAVKTATLLIERVFSIHCFPTSIVSDRDPKFTSRFWIHLMANIKIDLNMATAYHHQTNGQTERRIRTVRQWLRNYIGPKGSKWVRHLPHVQTAINAAPSDSTELSPFEITFGRIINLLPSVKVSPTAVPAADEIATQITKNQQLARTALKKARARQTTTSENRRKDRPSIIPGTTEVTLKSSPYVHKIGRNHKLVGPWLGPFNVSEGPDKHNNYKLVLPDIMKGIHPWIHRSNLRIYLRPNLEAFPGLPTPHPQEPVIIDASGNELWAVEKILNDRIYRRKRQFLIHWKGYDEIEATWEPLEHLEAIRDDIRTYWFNTYNQAIPFEVPWTHNDVWSAWTLQDTEFIPLSPELDPDGFWKPIQDSDYSESEASTLPPLDESEMET